MPPHLGRVSLKIIATITAALFGAAAMLAPTAAAAQQTVTTKRVVVTQRSHNVRYGGDHYRTKRVCKVKYRNHRRIRTCRTIRVRY